MTQNRCKHDWGHAAAASLAQPLCACGCVCRALCCLVVHAGVGHLMAPISMTAAGVLGMQQRRSSGRQHGLWCAGDVVEPLQAPSRTFSPFASASARPQEQLAQALRPVAPTSQSSPPAFGTGRARSSSVSSSSSSIRSSPSSSALMDHVAALFGCGAAAAVAADALLFGFSGRAVFAPSCCSFTALTCSGRNKIEEDVTA